MKPEIIILSLQGTALFITFGLIIFTRHRYYKQIMKKKDKKLTEQLKNNHKQATKLASLKTNYKQLENICSKLKINIALYEQKIDGQVKIVAKLNTEKEKLISKLEVSNDEIKILTAFNAKLENSQNEKSKQLEEHKLNKLTLRNQLEQAEKKNTTLETDIREQQITLKAEKEKLSELKVQFEKQKNELKYEFKVVSEEIIKERQKVLNERNKEEVGTLLKPLQNQIISFQHRVNEVHSETIKGNTNLEAEIKKVLDVGLKMRSEANNLTSALKGNSQQRGAWGEAQLKRTLEMSGLVEDTHYEKQSSFRDQTGKQKQTDYLIKLPGNKHIIIDSKLSLIAYDRATSAKTESERSLAIDEHVKSVKKHIDDLAAKDYINLIGIHSPSFVLMFMPIEPAYIEALKHDKDLFGYGCNRSIMLVSHTTLVPILRTVANIWMLEQSNKETREISEKAGDIYNSVSTIAERLLKLGNTLNTASTQYNHTVKAISGRQGLQGKVERFARLSNKVSKTIPELKSRHFEYETLQLIIQPLSMDQKKSIKVEDNKNH